jgi:DNA-binding transcriptional MerR regulator
MDRHLSPSEVARRFGVSIKALRLYERRGLIKPLRSAAGWRAYGPGQIGRLHQILALKKLGLSLARIAELLAGPDRLDAVLALQEQALRRDNDRLAAALVLVGTARAKLAAGEALSVDDLATLTQETVMPAKRTAEDIKRQIEEFAAIGGKILAPIWEKHMTEESRESFRALKLDRAEVLDNASRMMIEAKSLMDEGNPMSPAAIDWARRWTELARRFTGGNPLLIEKERAMRQEARNNHALQQMLKDAAPLLATIGEFMRPAMEFVEAERKEA